MTRPAPPRAQDALSQREFIALMGLMSASVAFSLDAMLPAFPQIAAELSPNDANAPQLLITTFAFGMGIGTFLAGPIADAIGRKPVVLIGLGLYAFASFVAWLAPTLESVILARFLQGLAVAGPRVMALAMTRDLYGGRDMARIVSYMMIVFTIVPALAPSLGAGIIALSSWREIFLAFIAFALVISLWLGLRQPETLNPEFRRSLSITTLRDALQDMISRPMVRLSMLAQCLVFATLFSGLLTSQQSFEAFGQGTHFHVWFGGIAVLAASASFINARLVMRLGMRALVFAMLRMQVLFSISMILIWLLPLPNAITFAAYAFWTFTLFFQAGLCIGNLNALAMEPLNHIAGIATSVMAGLATTVAVVLATIVGQSYNGTPLPAAIGVLSFNVVAVFIVSKMKKLERVAS